MRSMTGFGRSKYENEGREYTVEIKSVNHKYCDISIKIPRCISYLEEKVKKTVSSNISRGKVDVYISFNNNSTKGKSIKINEELAGIYIKQLRELAAKESISDNILVTEISKFPDVLIIESVEDEELIWSELIIALEEALTNFINMRSTEGQEIYEDFVKRINIVKTKTEEISKYSTRLIQDYIVKLESRIKELLKTDVIDETRLAGEVVIYADKCSVEEEITRLSSHISQFNNLIREDAVGKKLDFLIQEMNREINTIGSKANSIDITNLVIDIKTSLEDIREQVQNVE